MGLETNNYAAYLSIGDGKITKRVKQQTEKSVQRTNKEGKIVHEEIFDAISGILFDIKITEHKEYGRFWNIYLRDGDQEYNVQINYSGGYASAFLKTLPNVDFTKRVRLIPNLKIDGTKKKVTLFVSQDGHALKHFWNDANRGDLPEMVQIKVKGKLQWDDSAMMAYLEEMVKTEILPKLKKTEQTTTPTTGKKEPITADIEDDTKDLPF